MFLIITVLYFALANSFILNNKFYYKNIINSPEIGSLHMISGGVWSLRKTPLKYENPFLEMASKRNILNINTNNTNNQDNSTETSDVKLPPIKPKPIRPIGTTIHKSLSFNEDEKDEKIVKKVYLIEQMNCFV